MPPQDFDALMKAIMTNPMGSRKKRVVLDDGQDEEILFEISSETVLNKAGMPEAVTTNLNFILGDGTSMTGVTRCQKCSSMVSSKSLHRCRCGRTVCLTRGCGKVWGGKWFCGFRCFILYKLRLLRKI